MSESNTGNEDSGKMGTGESERGKSNPDETRGHPAGHHKDPTPSRGPCKSHQGLSRRQGEGLPQLAAGTAISGRDGRQADFAT